MSTVDDLRSTLDDRARAVEDPGASPRVVAVHERVRGLRRRRRTTAGVLAAAVALAGVGVAGALRDPVAGPDPAGPPPVVAGQQVPGTATVMGSEYAYVDASEAEPGADRLVLTLPPDEGLRAVSLVGSDLGDGWATLSRDGQAIARVLGDGTVSSPVPVGDQRTRLVVDLEDLPDDARVGLAVFERTGEIVGGVVEPGGAAYFRQVRDDATLVDAVFGEPGRAEVSLDVRGALGTLQLADFCRTETEGLWVKMSVDGEGWAGGPCTRGPAEVGDVAGSHTTRGSVDAPVRRHTIRVYVTRGEKSQEPVSDASTVVGLGIYQQQGRQEVLGMGVAGAVDYEGRRWTLDRVLPATDRDGVVTTLPAQDEALLLGMVVRRGGGAALQWRGSVSGRVGPVSYLVPYYTAYGMQGQLLPGEEWTVRTLQEREQDPSEVAVLLYRPVDRGADVPASWGDR